MNDLPPDPEDMNDARAEYANRAVTAFAHATNTDVGGEPNETILGDLLTNLMHWCDRQGIDFDAKLLGARVNYDAETSSEG